MIFVIVGMTLLGIFVGALAGYYKGREDYRKESYLKRHKRKRDFWRDIDKAGMR